MEIAVLPSKGIFKYSDPNGSTANTLLLNQESVVQGEPNSIQKLAVTDLCQQAYWPQMTNNNYAHQNVIEGDSTMFFIDVPLDSIDTQRVLIASVDQRKGNKSSPNRILGVCQITPNGLGSDPTAENLIDPKGNAKQYFREYEGRKVTGLAKVSVLENIKYGTLTAVGAEVGEEGLFQYSPEKGYIGKDKAILQVEIGGLSVSIIYYFQSIPGVALGNTTEERLCEKHKLHWKIASNFSIAIALIIS